MSAKKKQRDPSDKEILAMVPLALLDEDGITVVMPYAHGPALYLTWGQIATARAPGILPVAVVPVPSILPLGVLAPQSFPARRVTKKRGE